jgi:hypothetical protein
MGRVAMFSKQNINFNVLNRGLRNLIKVYNSGLHIRSLKGMPRSENQSSSFSRWRSWWRIELYIMVRCRCPLIIPNLAEGLELTSFWAIVHSYKNSFRDSLPDLNINKAFGMKPFSLLACTIMTADWILNILFYYCCCYAYDIKYNSVRGCGYWTRFAGADKDLADAERILLCVSAQGSSYNRCHGNTLMGFWASWGNILLCIYYFRLSNNCWWTIY